MISRNFCEKISKCSSFWRQVGAGCRYAESWWGTVALLVLKHAARASGKASWQGTSAFLCKIPTSPDLAMSRNKVSSILCKYLPALTLKKQDNMFALTRTYVCTVRSEPVWIKLKISWWILPSIKTTYIIDAVTSSGILKAKQKLGRTFNSDKLGGIAFTKISKLPMCSAYEEAQAIVPASTGQHRHCTCSVLKIL